MSVLILSAILRPFVNTLTADDKYCRSIITATISNAIKWETKLFLDPLLHFWNVHEIKNIF